MAVRKLAENPKLTGLKRHTGLTLPPPPPLYFSTLPEALIDMPRLASPPPPPGAAGTSVAFLVIAPEGNAPSSSLLAFCNQDKTVLFERA